MIETHSFCLSRSKNSLQIKLTFAFLFMLYQGKHKTSPKEAPQTAVIEMLQAQAPRPTLLQGPVIEPLLE